MQGRWIDDSSLLCLPHLGPEEVEVLEEAGLGCLPLLVEALSGTDSSSSGNGSGSGADSKGGSSSRRAAAEAVLEGLVGAARAKEVVTVCDRMPVVQLGVGKVPRLVRVRRGGEEGEGDGEEEGGEGGQGAGAQEEEEWEVELELSRVRQGDRRGGRPRVYAPRFPKVRGWGGHGRA